ncbi:proteasome lid subunit RPN8/RPN11 [Methylobacterium brachiatum]|uniref:Proteasome lid subunit RPN8/RPN11 n=1 Tax=Methylobacterium brachiatum TaxID=269660 RepID=A0AAJ1TWA4_9HYPH|nr:Mov34/MPN/PAD-1 family protein [Methylobacterium brachiatum]MCB4803719.1 Mov34/MPN/PAD-1 family protein [Methylobacterium brachiatum]MDQ0544973.1 proteasome lid subunit RPN8/RPN11 [Methylobacterium brachiatum]
MTIPRACADEAQQHMHSVGRDGHEGLALWVGRQDGERFQVEQTWIPAQRHIRTDDGVCVCIGPDELHRINVRLHREKLTLLGQIHSHPGRAYHSDADDAYAIATAVGSLSLVVPDYAVRPFALTDIAAYRLEARARWARVPRSALLQLLTITD